MNLIYRATAVEDVDHAFEYIHDVLKNPNAAESLRRRIAQAAALLKENPYMGTPLDSKAEGLETSLRFVIVSKHLIFYEVREDRIEILRVLDGRTDYLSHLLE